MLSIKLNLADGQLQPNKYLTVSFLVPENYRIFTGFEDFDIGLHHILLVVGTVLLE
jgi:hypothetical protein